MRPTSSPWGKIDSCERFSAAKDTYSVGTPGHGGLMMPSSEATRLKISQFGERFGSKWMCFEEDCQVVVAILVLMLNKELPMDKDKAKGCLTSIRYWNHSFFDSFNPEEFGSVGAEISELINELKPDFQKIDSERKLREQDDQMRREKSPDLIVSASSVSSYNDFIRFLKTLPRDISEQEDSAKFREIIRSLRKEVEFYDKDEEAVFHKPAVVIVWTADGRRHLVRNYDSSRGLNLLSLCEKIGSFLE